MRTEQEEKSKGKKEDLIFGFSDFLFYFYSISSKIRVGGFEKRKIKKQSP